MKNFSAKSVTLLLLVVCLLVVQSCTKEEQIVTPDVPNTNLKAQSQSSTHQKTAKSNSSYSLYNEFKSEFCVRGDIIAAIPLEARYGTIEITGTDGQVYTAYPFKSEIGDIDFLVETKKGESYVLSNSDYWYYQELKSEREVPNSLKTLYLFDDLLLLNGQARIHNTKESIANRLSSRGNVQQTGERLQIQLTNTNRLPLQVARTYEITTCRYRKGATVSRYINRIGFPASGFAADTYEYIVENALINCGFDCVNCADPICVFDEILQEINPDNTTNIERVQEAFVQYGLGLDEQIVDVLAQNLIDGLFYFIKGITEEEEVCYKLETATLAIDNCGNDTNCIVQDVIDQLEALGDKSPYSSTNQCERDLIHQYPICALAIASNFAYANLTTRRKIGWNDQDDCSDAYRHAIFNAANACYCGETLARAFGEAHECETVSEIASDMDIFNNEAGYAIVNSNPLICPNPFVINASVLEQDVCQFLEDGQLLMLDKPDNHDEAILIMTNTCECN